MKKLEKVGAVAIVKTEVIKGIIAKYYDLIIDEISIKSNEEDEESLEHIKKAFEEQWIQYYDNARSYAENMMKKSGKKDEIQPLDEIMGENYVYLSEKELENFSSEISEVIKKYIKNPKENRHKYHVLKSIIRVE